MFFIPPAAITATLEFGAAAIGFVAQVCSNPSKLLFWRKKRPGLAVTHERARAAHISSEVRESLRIAEENAEQLDDIIAKVTPTKAELREMSKLELQILGNAHEIRFKKKTTKREMISTIVKKLHL